MELILRDILNVMYDKIEELAKKSCTIDDIQSKAYMRANIECTRLTYAVHEMMLEYGYGWIPVDVASPPEEIDPVTNDYITYQVTVNMEGKKSIRYFSYGDKHWHHGPSIMDKYVIAWRPNPEPYEEEDKN